MTHDAMIHDPMILLSLKIAASALAGAVFGFGYFAAVRRTAALVAAGRGWRVPLALTLGRLGLAVLLFGLAARLGVAYLLAAFGGFLAARWMALRAERSAR